MSTPIDHVAYLSQEIGPRPSGTEEEQQAALYIADRLHKDAHLMAKVEDFNCIIDPGLSKVACYVIALIMLVFSTLLPVFAVPAVILSSIAAVILVLETLDKAVVSRLLPTGISQNVVAKYSPMHDPDNNSPRRRKVVIMANYDSGKTRPDLARLLVEVRRSIDVVIFAAGVFVPVFLVIWGVILGGEEGTIAFIGTVVKVILSVIMLVPVVLFVIDKTSNYNEAANCNASGVAVMLEVARRLGRGEATQSPELVSGVMHDEQTAYEAGVVPDGATLHYEDTDPQAGREPSVAAGLSTTREQPTGRVRDIADNLVQVKDAPILPLDEESLSKVRQDTRTALSSAPADILTEVASKAAGSQGQVEQGIAEAALAQVAAYEQAVRETARQTETAAAPKEDTTRQHIQEEKKPVGVPDWYKKATEKTRHKTEYAGGLNEFTKYRSRYATLPNESSKEGRGVADNATSFKDGADDQGVPADLRVADKEDKGEVVSIEGDAPRVTEDVFVEKESSIPDSTSESVEVASAPGAPPTSLAPEDSSDHSLAPKVAEVQSPTKPASAHIQTDQTDSTTAMSPLENAGKLDLDALRAAAKATSAKEPQDGQGASDDLKSVTARLPQMMYYTPPADRSDTLHDRAQKDRVTVSAEGIEQAAVMDAAESALEESRYGLHGRRPRVAERTTLSPSVSSEEPTPVFSETATVSSDEEMVASQSEERLSQSEEYPVQPEERSYQPEEHSVQPKEYPSTSRERGGARGSAPARREMPSRSPIVDLPEITFPPITESDPQMVSFEDFRQRAPLAEAAESSDRNRVANPMASMLPTIESGTSEGNAWAATPSFSPKHQSVSLTGSFAAIDGIGSRPVGDELIEGVSPDDIYVDDVDDSSFEGGITKTGAFAGPGYVEMPQSRIGRFFGRFRRNKRAEEEESPQEWLGVDEGFDARSAGKARGSWGSFRDDEGWSGGAFSSARVRARGNGDALEDDSAPDREVKEAGSRSLLTDVAGVTADEFAAVAAMAANKSTIPDKVPYDETEEAQQVYSFASEGVNTEVWFVALGSELADQGGIRAFLADHASDMRGALIVNLEALGVGELHYLEREGAFKQVGCSPRMKRLIRKASQASGIDMPGARIDWRDSPASFAAKHRVQAVTIAGMDGKKPAMYCEANDIIENVDEKMLAQAADFVIALLKSI